MRIITLLFVLFATMSYGQTRYYVQFNHAYNSGKEVLAEIENHIFDTYDRQVNELGIDFATVVDYELPFIDSILQLAGVQNPTVSKEKYVATNDVEKAAGNNCEQAMQLCSSSSVLGNSGGFGIQELPNNNTIDGCLSVEHQSSWYYLNVLLGGSLVMRINPDDNDDDYDFAIWGPFTSATAGANCPPITSPIRCSYSQEDGNTGMEVGAGDNSEGSGGDGWIEALNVAANSVYIILIDNFSTSNEGYNINFSWSGGHITTATIACVPVVLPVGLTEFEGHKMEDSNILTWATESEENNDFFTLEWSATGLTNEWETIQTIDGAGDSQTKRYYSAVHDGYRKGSTNYYRLTQTDFNGAQITAEKIVAIDNKLEEKQIERIVNLLGQEVSINENGIVVVIYADGTQEKRFNQN